MRVKENEYKEKIIYGWCASKEKNTDTTWEVAGKPGHDGIHYHTRRESSMWGKSGEFKNMIISETFSGREDKSYKGNKQTF